MKTKNRIFVLGLIAVAVILIITLLVVHYSENEYYTLSDIRNEYVSLDDKVIVNLSGEEITQKDLCIIKYLYYKKNCIDLAVRQKSVSILAKKDGFTLSPQEEYQDKKYVCNNYEKLNLPETEINKTFKVDLIENSLDLSIYYSYISNIIIQILDCKLECDDKLFNFKYGFFKYLNEQNENGKLKTPYFVRVNLAEKLAFDYIDYKIEKYEIFPE